MHTGRRGSTELYFLSHAGQDCEVAKRLAEALVEAGIDVWCDVLPGKLTAGKSWVQEIDQALGDSAGCLILVGSRDIDQWVRAEVECVLNRQAVKGDEFRIVPVLLADMKPEDLPTLLGRFQVVHVPEGGDWVDQEFIEEVKSHLHAEEPADVGETECPFPGLEAFHESHARFFCGRSAEIGEAIERLGTTPNGHRRWLQIEGPSGSGKSSLARAGVIPRVRRGLVTDVRRSWQVVALSGALWMYRSAEKARVRAERVAESEWGARAMVLAQDKDKVFQAVAAGIRAVAPSLRRGESPPARNVEGFEAAMRAAKTTRPLRGHTRIMWHAGSFTQDGRYIVTSHPDSTRIWNARTASLAQALRGRWIQLRSRTGQPVPPRDRVLTLSGAETILWDIATGKRLHNFEQNRASRVYLSGDGAVSGGYAGDSTQVWDLDSLALLRTLPGRPIGFSPSQSSDRERTVTFERGNTRVESGREIRHDTVTVWSVKTGERLCAFPGPTDHSVPARLLRGNRYVVSDGAGGQFGLQLALAAALDALNAPEPMEALPEVDLPDLPSLPAPGINVRGAETGRRLHALGTGKVLGASPDDRYVVTVNYQLQLASLLLWDVETGQRLHAFPLQGPLPMISMRQTLGAASLAFSEDGAFLAVPYHTGNIDVWDTKTGAKISTLGSRLEDAEQSYVHVTFVPDTAGFVRRAVPGDRARRRHAEAVACPFRGGADSTREAARNMVARARLRIARRMGATGPGVDEGQGGQADGRLREPDSPHGRRQDMATGVVARWQAIGGCRQRQRLARVGREDGPVAA